MLPGKKGSEAKNPGNRVSPPPPAPPPPKISKKQISEVRKRYGLSEEEAYEAFFNEGFSAGQEAGKEQGKYDYAALNLVLENVEERTGQEISSLKMDMKILNADLRNEKQLTGIYEDKLAEAQDNLRITTIVCENAINEREAERKNMDEAYTILKLFPIKSGTLERAMSLLKSRKQGSETKVITPSQKDHYNITKKEKGSELLTTTNSEGKTSNKDKPTSEKGTTNEQKAGEKK